MEKWVPYKKLSKKAKQEINSSRRKDWGAMSPVTRRPEKPNAYNRKKARQWDREFDSLPSLLFV